MLSAWVTTLLFNTPISMKPEELIQLYALEEAINYVLEGLGHGQDTVAADMLYKLFVHKVNDSGLDMDEYRTLHEAYKNPPVREEEAPPPSPFPWIKSEYVGAGWKKR